MGEKQTRDASGKTNRGECGRPRAWRQLLCGVARCSQRLELTVPVVRMNHAPHARMLLQVLRGGKTFSAVEKNTQERERKQTAGSRVLVTRYTAWPSLTTDQKRTRTPTTFARYNDGCALIPSEPQKSNTHEKKSTQLLHSFPTATHQSTSSVSKCCVLNRAEKHLSLLSYSCCVAQSMWISECTTASASLSSASPVLPRGSCHSSGLVR